MEKTESDGDRVGKKEKRTEKKRKEKKEERRGEGETETETEREREPQPPFGHPGGSPGHPCITTTDQVSYP